MTKISRKELVEIGKRIEALRLKLGIEAQAEFAARLSVTQPRVSAWEKGKERPTCEAFARLGNVAMRDLNDTENALWFWQKAGLDAGLMRRAAGNIREKRMGGSPEEKVIPVPPLSGDGPDWYLDARLVPEHCDAAYWDSEQAGHPGLGGRQQVVVLDTSAKWNESWRRGVLIESDGPSEENPGLPPYGIQMGRFDLRLIQYGELAPLCAVKFWSFDYRQFPEYQVAVFNPSLMQSEGEMLAEEYALENRKKINAAARRVEEREKVTCAMPKGIRLLGRVLLWFRPPEKESK